MVLGRLAKPLAAMLPATSSDPGGATFLRRLKAMLDAVPDRLAGPSPVDRPQTFPATGLRRKRVALMPGCGQQVLAPEVNEATVRLLTRHDIEVVNVAGSGCCGSSVLHVGRNEEAIAFAKRNIEAWLREIDGAGLDAIVINASGCGTTVKDYGHMLADDPAWKEKAEQVASLARDVSEVMLEVGLANVTARPLTVAYHSACSMQHGQKVTEQPKKLLRDAGFIVQDVPEGHICCGWAGTYQVLAARAVAAAARPQGRQHREPAARRHRRRQFRLHRQYRLGHWHSDCTYGRAARLGDGRTQAAGPALGVPWPSFALALPHWSA